jgi:putative Holliday junction resolvase
VRVLAIDLGQRRIGLAVSDPDGELALPAGTLVRRDARTDLAELRRTIAERDIERVVVGLPLHMDGRAGREALAAQRFADTLARDTGLPVETFDERWTTREAERALREGGRRGPRSRAVVDAVAATLLLRAWLGARRSREAGGEGGA